MGEFQVGFIGAGSIARTHATRVEELGQAVAAVADIDPEVRAEFAAEYGTTAEFEDYERMLAESDIDVCVIAVPNALHADCAVAALDAGVNVFVEKPLAATLSGAERVATAAAESDADAMVGFMKVFDGGAEAVDTAVKRGDFGDVYEVSVEYVRRRGIPQLGSWFTREELAGGGALIDIGPHVLHLALSLLGFPDIERVSASTGAHFGNRDDYTYLDMWGGDPTDDPEFTVEDHARAHVRTADGTTIALDVAWASNRDPVQRIQVLGDDAGATMVPEDDHFDVYGTRDGTLSTDTRRPPRTDSFLAEWEYFFDVLRGERTHTRNTVSEGIAVQRLIDAIYRSADRGREVEV